MAAGRQRFSIISDGLPTQLPDIDPDETREWVDSFGSMSGSWVGSPSLMMEKR